MKTLAVSVNSQARWPWLALALYLFCTPTIQAEEITVGFPTGSLPFHGLDDKNQPTGFAIEVMQQLAARSNMNLQFRGFDSDEQVIAALRQDLVQIVPGIRVTGESHQFTFVTDPLISYPVSIFVRNERAGFQSYQDLSGKTIGVVEGAEGQPVLEQNKQLVVRTFNDTVVALHELIAGRIDGLAAPEPVIWKKAGEVQLDDKLTVLQPPLLEVRRVIAINIKHPELQQRLQGELFSFLPTEQYSSLYSSWFGKPRPPWYRENIGWIIAALVAALAMVLMIRRYISVLTFNRRLLDETDQRDVTEIELRSSREDLEHRVQERTQELEKITERFSGVFDSIDSGIVVYTPEKGITLNNAKAAHILALVQDEKRGITTFNPGLQFIDEDRNLLRAENYPINKIINQKKPPQGILSGILKPDSKAITWVLVNGVPLFGPGGKLSEIIISIVDVTDIQLAKERLHQAATVFANTGEGVTITDLKGNIVDVNQAFTDITGYSKKEILGQNPRLLQSGNHDAEFYEEMWSTLIETGHWRGEVWNKRKNGEEYPELLTISRITDSHRKTVGYVGVFSDITSIKASEKKMEYLAHHDALTDLPNRLLFNDRLDQSIKHAARQHARLGIIFVDLDRFKTINDSLGHPAGDALLRQVSDRLKQAVRADDTVARLSGDEFIILLENVTSIENTTIAVEKLMATFDSPFNADGNDVRMSCSMGISLYPTDSDEATKLLRYADAAMYQAKENGRNCYQFYTREITAAAYEDVIIENAMRGAIERQELTVLYQPQVELSSSKMIGMESLIRWEHPELGMVPPTRFIPIAEKTGLISEIGLWVLTTTCQQARHWLNRGFQFGYISVNVSGRQFQSGNFSSLVEKTLTDNHVPPECIELEVTESFVMKKTEDNIQQLEAIQALGIKLAIDDFGTGYSSLSYLKSLPIDKIKIDQSFVRDIPQDKNDMAIAEAVILMGKALHLQIIAEGIETVEQLRFLKEKGCDGGQGDLYSYPLPAAEIEHLIIEQKVG